MKIDEGEELDCSKMENSRSVTLDWLNYFLPTRTAIGFNR